MGCNAGQPVMAPTPSEVSSQVSHQEFKVPSPECCVVEENEFHDTYLLGKKLGRGNFAQVHVATRRSSGLARGVKRDEDVAVKIISMQAKNDKKGEATFLLEKSTREATNWKKLGQHRNCVVLHELFCGSNFSYMVMEKCDEGLFQSLEAMPDITERSFGNVIAQMLLGIGHCHSCNVIHRDVKPDNFLVSGDGGMHVKLADFGFSTLVIKQAKATGVFGTAPFMSPEMLLGEKYDEKVDVWSLAVVVYAFLFGSFPYTPTKEAISTLSGLNLSASRAMKQAVRIGTTPSFKPSSRDGVARNGQMRSDEAMQLVKALLNRDPDSRPSAKDALQMPWLVASLQGNHLPDVALPSLRPMLYAAKRAGAFELRDSRKATADDHQLNKLQQGDMSAGKPRASLSGYDVDLAFEEPVPGRQLSPSSNSPTRSRGLSESTETHMARKSKDWETASNRSTVSGSSSVDSEQIRWSRCGSQNS